MSDRTAHEALRERLHGAEASSTHPAAWKVALNFPAFQKRLGLTHALAAPLAQLTVYESGDRLAFAPARLLHVEAEIALRLGAHLDSASSDEELRSSIESYAPCLELVDYALPRNSLHAMFAHSFFHAGVVLGPSVEGAVFEPLAATLPTAEDAQGARHVPVPGTVPGDLTQALRGVLDLALEAGTQLYRGQLVLCGSYIDPIPLPPGAHVTVDYGPHHAALKIARSAT